MTNEKHEMSNDSQVQLSVILPSYGEADNLRELLPVLRLVTDSLAGPQGAEILVVDTQSPMDDTPAVCQAQGARYVPRQGDNTYGSAIRTGIAASRGRFVAVMDADGSHDPHFLRQMWGQRDQADVVIASRYIPGGRTDNPWFLVAMSRILNLVFKIVVRMQVVDVSNSFRLYRGEMLRRLSLVSHHFDIMEEILVKLLWESPQGRGARVTELPFSFQKRRHGKPKRNLVVFAWWFLLSLFRMRRLRRKYRRTVS